MADVTPIEIKVAGESNEDGFIVVKRSRGTRVRASSTARPSVRLTSSEFHIADEIFHELGDPAMVGISINARDKMVRFEKRERGDKNPGEMNYRVKYREYADGVPHYTVRVSTDKTVRKIVTAIPQGFYVSIGGGVYKYSGLTPPLR